MDEDLPKHNLWRTIRRASSSETGAPFFTAEELDGGRRAAEGRDGRAANKNARRRRAASDSHKASTIVSAPQGENAAPFSMAEELALVGDAQREWEEATNNTRAANEQDHEDHHGPLHGEKLFRVGVMAQQRLP
jgi:hypothetical protein